MTRVDYSRCAVFEEFMYAPSVAKTRNEPIIPLGTDDSQEAKARLAFLKKHVNQLQLESRPGEHYAAYKSSKYDFLGVMPIDREALPLGHQKESAKLQLEKKKETYNQLYLQKAYNWIREAHNTIKEIKKTKQKVTKAAIAANQFTKIDKTQLNTTFYENSDCPIGFYGPGYYVNLQLIDGKVIIDDDKPIKRLIAPRGRQKERFIAAYLGTSPSPYNFEDVIYGLHEIARTPAFINKVRKAYQDKKVYNVNKVWNKKERA